MIHIGLNDRVTLIACAGHLALAFLVFARGGRTSLSLTLSALCIDFFAFNAADVAAHFSSSRGWVRLDTMFASMLAPIVLHLVLLFVGRRREFARLLNATYAAYGAIALVCLAAFVSKTADDFDGSDEWAYAVLAGVAPIVVFIIYVLWQHVRRPAGDAERARTYLFIGAFAIGCVGCLTDLIADTGLFLLRLGNVGTLASTILLATVVLRFRLFERNISYVMALNAVIVGGLQVFAYLTVFRFLATHRAMLILGTVTVTLAVLPFVRGMFRAQAVHRERLEYHATLGRFSAQMAHDLRNPLAAVKGAAQLLQGNALSSDSVEYVTLILGQVDRINRVISHYQRLGRLEVVRSLVDVNQMVEEIASHQALAAGTTVKLETKLAQALGPCQLDRDLFAAALENLIRNAVEAMPQGGMITIATEDATSVGSGFAAICVRDAGSGMSPRVIERAFDDFFTTKSQGSGLGLAFARRVAEVHGGDAMLESVEGAGTTVRLRFRTT